MREVYPRWESLIANWRCQIYFRPNNLGTADHFASRLGRRKHTWGGEDWAAALRQPMGGNFRKDCITFGDPGEDVRAGVRQYAALGAARGVDTGPKLLTCSPEMFPILG
ncbi:hypothetical protein OCH7691_04531 [Oceanibacterium hippocampi]|uniref:Uncharacterized protein n=1 Tax=Oceanibacterium hippocampi TaxID=745714 RepID=A0A1Y5TZZ8_9PROT|nr:hypothetical protein OCH7691_04531 [Oceanibacterium hippocampi]